jgi:peptidoglycan/xylan/chitin deacetylase (PgdA/CDA1 family)
MRPESVFCISLDFELHWGSVQSNKLDERYKRIYINTRKLIPELLSIFSEYGIRVTWATVGMLFNRDETEWEKARPNKKPGYLNKSVSTYQWVKENGFNDCNSIYHFAPDLIKLISTYDGMEIGTHTYSHFFCQQMGQTGDEFKLDLEKAVEKASDFEINLNSLVFPRNEFNKEYLQICQNLDIRSVRSNPDAWFWDLTGGDSIYKRIVRIMDAYWCIDNSNITQLSNLKNQKSMPLLIPASRFLRPWSKIDILNRLRMKRILNEMTKAAKNKCLYHLWWHPENFGENPKKSLQDLRIILKHFAYLKNQYNMTSLNMEDIHNVFCVNN